MDRIAKALLTNGKEIEYVITDNPPRGGMKHTYFTPDKAFVVQFFNDPANARDQRLQERISAIIGQYNPTVSEEEGGAKGNDKVTASYFAKRFCWPVAIVKRPEFGIVCPVYPKNFFFDENASQILKLKGKDKKSSWFTGKNRKYLNSNECGNFRSMIQMSLLLARSLRRMHQAGLAHSDLSFNNVLTDPKTGTCVIIDIDTLVVPGLFPPEVIGTRGYIAPEVLQTLGLPREKRFFPSVLTDLHSMAVLIYEYLFFRHPIIGPKIYSEDAEQDDYLCLGKCATFIEDPNDTSNRPDDLEITIHDMGPHIEKLFLRAFSEGLHEPVKRPSAMEWEQGLVKTWNLLHTCSNPNCEKRFFILYDVKKPICPFCQTRVKDKKILKLIFMTERKGAPGHYFVTNELIAENNTPLCSWDLYSTVFPDEKAADREVKGFIKLIADDYYLVNINCKDMLSPNGNIIPPGHAALLSDGTAFKIVSDTNSHLLKVELYDNI